MNIAKLINGIRRRMARLESRVMDSDCGAGRRCAAMLRRLRGFRIDAFGPNNRVELGKVSTRRFDATFVGSGNSIRVSDGASVVRMSAHFCGSNSEIVLENDVKVDGLFVWITGDNARVVIRQGAILLNSSIYLTEHNGNVQIGEHCMFAGGTTLRCGDGHAVFDLDSGQILNHSHHITVGDHVWLTTEVLVLKDVTIGSGSVVASRSIVTRDLPPNTLAAGVPAKVLRSNIGWRIEHIDGLPEGWFNSPPTHTAEAIP